MKLTKQEQIIYDLDLKRSDARRRMTIADAKETREHYFYWLGMHAAYNEAIEHLEKEFGLNAILIWRKHNQ